MLMNKSHDRTSAPFISTGVEQNVQLGAGMSLKFQKKKEEIHWQVDTAHLTPTMVGTEVRNRLASINKRNLIP